MLDNIPFEWAEILKMLIYSASKHEINNLSKNILIIFNNQKLDESTFKKSKMLFPITFTIYLITIYLYFARSMSNIGK